MQTSELTDALTCYILHYKREKRQNIPRMTRSVDGCFAQQHRQKKNSRVLHRPSRTEILFYTFAPAETTARAGPSGLACRRRHRVSPPLFVFSKEVCSAIVLAATLR